VTDFAGYVQEYLHTRRALGFKLEFPGQVLPQFAAYLRAEGASTLTVSLAIAWADTPRDVLPIMRAHRLGAVRGFAKYLKTIEPATEVPPCGIWPSTSPRPTPYLWSDSDVVALLQATRDLQPRMRALTHETLFGLLAVSGMRVGEALRLCRDDVDLVDGVLTIREGKFGRSRLIPLHPSTTAALRAYAAHRDENGATARSDMFFVAAAGTGLRYSGVLHTFTQLTTRIGLRTPSVRPRIHDLRHSFAVRSLLDWHRCGVPVEPRMPVLSIYLGHVDPAGTYWYLSAAPELMELAAARLHARFGAQR
jgi:integrase/recombinase XerD